MAICWTAYSKKSWDSWVMVPSCGSQRSVYETIINGRNVKLSSLNNLLTAVKKFVPSHYYILIFIFLWFIKRKC